MFAKDDLQQRWWKLEAELVERFGKKPDLEAIFDSYGRIITSRILSDSMTGSTTIIFYAFI